MNKFVDQIANHIKEQDYKLTDLTIVIPSRRAKKYLQRALFEAYGKAIFSPKIITIDQWIKDLTPQVIIDKTKAVFKLYDIHKGIKGTENKGIDEFLKWGRTLLSDFDEIDRYLINHTDLFRNLADVKELESWNVDEDKLTTAQKRFMEFWDGLPAYYTKYKALLKTEKAINGGGAYKQLTEHIDWVFADNKEMKFIFAGFNALSKAEISIMKQLHKMGRAEIFIDADEFYYKNNNHEASSFLHVLKENLGEVKMNFVGNNIAKQDKKFEVINCTQSTGQAKVASTILLNNIKQKDLSDTVLLLADESLINPVLKNIPNTVHEANITLGLPLKNTSLRSWIDLIFNIQENFTRFNTKSLYYKDYLRLVKHPFLLSIISEDEKTELVKLEQKIAHKNWLFIKLSELSVTEKVKEILSLVWEKWDTNNPSYCKISTEIIRKINSKLFSAISAEEHTLEKAIIYNFDNALVKFSNIIEEFNPELAFTTFKSIFNEHWSTQSLAYYGNPLGGLQIMGLLETRLLDFKNMIVVGMNEGSMPPTNPIQTLIPMDLRKYHGLPTPREKQGLFAHHIYRLFHHVENCWITYSSAMHAMGVDEPSRYLHQIKLEMARQNTNINFVERDYTIKDEDQSSEQVSVEKTDAILQRLDEYFAKRTSASALNKYLSCPLDFYYRYILGYGEEKEVEEDIEASNFGSFIHNTLEELYAKFARYDTHLKLKDKQPSNITSLDLDKMLKEYGPILQREFIKHFDNHKEHLETGKNFLSHQIADFLVKKILKLQKEELIKNPDKHLFIEAVEGEFEKTLQVEVEGAEKKVNFIGFIDRIDNYNNETRILDYKSGKCDNDKVKITKAAKGKDETEHLIKQISSKAYVFQLLVYNMLYKEQFPQQAYPEKTGILSMVNVEDGPFFLNNGLTQSTSELMEVFEKAIARIVTEIYNKDLRFEHNPDSKYCQYCG